MRGEGTSPRQLSSTPPPLSPMEQPGRRLTRSGAKALEQQGESKDGNQRGDDNEGGLTPRKKRRREITGSKDPLKKKRATAAQGSEARKGTQRRRGRRAIIQIREDSTEESEEEESSEKSSESEREEEEEEDGQETAELMETEETAGVTEEGSRVEESLEIEEDPMSRERTTTSEANTEAEASSNLWATRVRDPAELHEIMTTARRIRGGERITTEERTTVTGTRAQTIMMQTRASSRSGFNQAYHAQMIYMRAGANAWLEEERRLARRKRDRRGRTHEAP